MSIDLESIGVLGKDGAVARRLPGYEHRPQQLRMAAAVERAFREGRHLVVEAGTGVGKSFAYLVPAILRATAGGKGDKPVVISTGTIALQEQLISRDIPFLRSVWDREFTAVLAKGRGNYLSRRRLALALSRARAGDLFNAENAARHVERLAEWAATAGDGSLSDLDFAPDSAAWTAVESDRNNCLGKRCPTYETCFFQRAKRRIYNAHILVVNHHLLFADLALKMNGVSYLPDYEYLIIDEAHEVEDIASEHLGIRVSRASYHYYLNSLRHRNTGRGLLATYRRLESVAPLVERARGLGAAFFDEILSAVIQAKEGRLRLREANLFTNEAPGVLQMLSLELARHAREAAGEEEELEIAAAAKRAMTLGDSLDAFITQALPDQVYWIERPETRYGDNVELRAAPIDVGELLRAHLFDRTRGVVLTSATLATGAGGREGRGASTSRTGVSLGHFGYVRRRLGLSVAMPEDVLDPREIIAAPVTQPAARAEAAKAADGKARKAPANKARAESPSALELMLDSPFDYPKQAILRVPDLPEPGQDGYDDALAREVLAAVRATSGGCFVLFTSYAQLRRTWDALEPTLTREGRKLLRQGDGVPGRKLLEMFRAGKGMVLFGTETFWQGVDVPGDALTGVIIARLPFAVPTDPLVAARMEAVERAGGNAFMDYSLPGAILKLKQGFGRLIRRSTDRGEVTILDSRIRRKPYGKRFIAALPPAKLEMP